MPVKRHPFFFASAAKMLFKSVSLRNHVTGNFEERFVPMFGNKALAFLSVSALFLSSLGCSMLQKMTKVDMFEGDNAVKAAQAIKDKVGAEVQVIRTEIRRDRMSVTIRSPKNPKDMDQYTYQNGRVSDPEPVQVMQMGDLAMTGDKYQTTNIDEIGFANLAATVAKAKELSKLEDAKVETVTMAYEHPTHTNPPKPGERMKPLGEVTLVFTWRLFVEAPRGRKDFWADKSGKLNEKAF
jgi:hypothetical protein